MANNLKKSEAQIIQLDRMAQLGQLAEGIAHELNNPLSGVLGQSEIMLEKLPLTDPYRQTFEKIARAADRCRKITKGLLDFSRQKDFHFELEDIVAVIDETVEMRMPDIAASKIIVIKNYGKGMPKIIVSAPHIQQVFLNIITNSIQSMRQGGTLTISARYEASLPISEFSISFTDTGQGISKENLSKIFTPFFTTRDPGKGTGLGLAISYGIIQRHNGKILVSSEGENKGATFTVKLPVTHSVEKKA